MNFVRKMIFSSSTNLWVVLIAILTTIGSEIKILPFSDEQFRFGFGSIIFFLLSLVRSTPILVTGIITSFSIVLFRTVIDILINEELFLQSVYNHIPAAVFYILFAFCLSLLKIEHLKVRPLLLGGGVALSEIISNCAEQMVRIALISEFSFHLSDLLLLSFVAFLRSFFVVGIYSTIIFSEQKKQVHEMLHLGSELYVETLYLQKAMNNIEKITATSYELYRKLMEQKDRSLSLQALHITQEIHEVKKDTQRIFAGLSKIVGEKSTDTSSLSQLVHLILDANESYSLLQRKKIQFHVIISGDLQTNKHIALLAIINNLIANAIEAIVKHGVITLTINVTESKTYIVVEDNGPGISPEILPIIFEPGYTSKYNVLGIAATGIGLSHVAEIVSQLEGTIQVESTEHTTFKITIPTSNIQIGDR